MAQPRAALSQEFAQAYRAHVEFVWRVLARHGVPDELLEDATQEVFVIMHRRFGAWGSDPVRAWLYGVARRIASTQLRTQARRLRKLAAVPAPPEQRWIDERVEDRLRLDALAKAIDALEPDRRDVFVLAEIEGLSAPEIAAALGCKLNTVYSRLHRARASIARAMRTFDAGSKPVIRAKELHGSTR